VTSFGRAQIAASLRAAGCVFAEAEADVLLATTRDPGVLAAMVARRSAGFPLEQVVGWADFCGVRVTVAEGVFVPRPRSELLVHAATRAIQEAGRSPIVVDLCCGTGAIGAAIAARVPAIRLHAADIDPAAVRCARANLAPGGGTRVHEGDLFAALPPELSGKVTVLVANVPYVPTAELALMPAEARCHEPRAALDGGADGLAVLGRVAVGAIGWLEPGGVVLMETSRAQRDQAMALLAGHGLEAATAHQDDLDATIVTGRRPAA